MDGSVFKEKPSFKILGLSFSSKLDYGCYIISEAANRIFKGEWDDKHEDEYFHITDR